MSKASFVLSAALAVAGYAGLAGSLLVIPVTAEAQQKVSAKIGVPLKAAQDAIARKRWDAALGKIKEADAMGGKTAFDQYKINETALVRLPAAGPQRRRRTRPRGPDRLGPDAGGRKSAAHQDARPALFAFR